MARKKQNSLFDQAKSFRDSDTAKAIGTVLAVLLIPASVIAWNYLSSSKTDIVDDKAASTEVEMTDENTTNENEETKVEEDSQTVSETKKVEEANGIGGVKVLPDTNSKE